ncbi:MAG TPA: hypothetical protein VMU53_03115 [Candidatus Sulfotelmatobacter sp.]|nr:hypothetical protein [Candidatus Sulfotelmatobacter sp.]
MGATAHATAALHQTVTIQHRVNHALGGNGDLGESAKETLANFARTPAGVLSFEVQNVILYLERKLVGITIRTPASVGEPVNAALLVAIENLVTSLTGNPKLSATFRHRLAS